MSAWCVCLCVTFYLVELWVYLNLLTTLILNIYPTLCDYQEKSGEETVQEKKGYIP